MIRVVKLVLYVLLFVIALLRVARAEKLTPDEVNQARMLTLSRQLAEMQELLQACEVKRAHSMSDEDDYDPKTLEIVRKAPPVAASPVAAPKPEARPTALDNATPVKAMDKAVKAIADSAKPPTKPKPKSSPAGKAVPK